MASKHSKAEQQLSSTLENRSPEEVTARRGEKEEIKSRKRREKRKKRRRRKSRRGGNRLRRKRSKAQSRNHNQLLKSSPTVIKDHKIGSKNDRKNRSRSKNSGQSTFNRLHHRSSIVSHRHRFADRQFQDDFERRAKNHHRHVNFEENRHGNPLMEKTKNKFLIPITLITSQGLLRLPLNPNIKVTIRVIEKSVFESPRPHFSPEKRPRVKEEAKGREKRKQNETLNHLRFRSSADSPFLKTKIKIRQNHRQNRVDGHRKNGFQRSGYRSKQIYYHYDYEDKGRSVIRFFWGGERRGVAMKCAKFIAEFCSVRYVS